MNSLLSRKWQKRYRKQIFSLKDLKYSFYWAILFLTGTSNVWKCLSFKGTWTICKAEIQSKNGWFGKALYELCCTLRKNRNVLVVHENVILFLIWKIFLWLDNIESCLLTFRLQRMNSFLLLIFCWIVVEGSVRRQLWWIATVVFSNFRNDFFLLDCAPRRDFAGHLHWNLLTVTLTGQKLLIGVKSEVIISLPPEVGYIHLPRPPSHRGWVNLISITSVLHPYQFFFISLRHR